MGAVNVCFKYLKYRDLLLAEQNSKLNELATTVRDVAGIVGPVSGMELLSVVSDPGYTPYCDNYSVRTQTLVEFLEDLGSETYEDFESLTLPERNSVFRLLGVLFTNAYIRISEVRAQRDERNAPSSALIPPVLPSQLHNLRPKEFNKLVKERRGRLANCYGAEHAFELEREFVRFRRYVSNSPTAMSDISRTTVGETYRSSKFSTAWLPFKTHFPILHSFVGGLASVFPGNSSVESDFSVMNWEKDEYRQSLTDISLEGIRQAKQHTRLRRLLHSI
ncbi:hypothetical protein FGB62_33g1115 [Gracilaria domingensis]|nr:hypothetical protein FGB62_33g1115 [Gracilaria domingensis]